VRIWIRTKTLDLQHWLSKDPDPHHGEKTDPDLRPQQVKFRIRIRFNKNPDLHQDLDPRYSNKSGNGQIVMQIRNNAKNLAQFYF
jgi:hypothetical protein